VTHVNISIQDSVKTSAKEEVQNCDKLAQKEAAA
jgi:hypothetical protein